MNNNKKKLESRNRRHNRVRAKISGTAERPRFCVFRSLDGIYLQLINDVKGATIVSQLDKGLKGNKTERAFQAGKLIAEKGKQAGIESVVFDRGAFIFHGRIKAVADGAREGGLKF